MAKAYTNSTILNIDFLSEPVKFLYKLPIYTYIIANVKSFTNLDVSSNIQSMELDMLCNKLERFD